MDSITDSLVSTWGHQKFSEPQIKGLEPDTWANGFNEPAVPPEQTEQGRQQAQEQKKQLAAAYRHHFQVEALARKEAAVASKTDPFPTIVEKLLALQAAVEESPDDAEAALRHLQTLLAKNPLLKGLIPSDATGLSAALKEINRTLLEQRLEMAKLAHSLQYSIPTFYARFLHGECVRLLNSGVQDLSSFFPLIMGLAGDLTTVPKVMEIPSDGQITSKASSSDFRGALELVKAKLSTDTDAAPTSPGTSDTKLLNEDTLLAGGIPCLSIPRMDSQDVEELKAVEGSTLDTPDVVRFGAFVQLAVVGQLGGLLFSSRCPEILQSHFRKALKEVLGFSGTISNSQVDAFFASSGSWTSLQKAVVSQAFLICVTNLPNTATKSLDQMRMISDKAASCRDLMHTLGNQKSATTTALGLTTFATTLWTEYVTQVHPTLSTLATATAVYLCAKTNTPLTEDAISDVVRHPESVIAHLSALRPLYGLHVLLSITGETTGKVPDIEGTFNFSAQPQSLFCTMVRNFPRSIWMGVLTHIAPSTTTRRSSLTQQLSRIKFGTGSPWSTPSSSNRSTPHQSGTSSPRVISPASSPSARRSRANSNATDKPSPHSSPSARRKRQEERDPGTVSVDELFAYTKRDNNAGIFITDPQGKGLAREGIKAQRGMLCAAVTNTHTIATSS